MTCRRTALLLCLLTASAPPLVGGGGAYPETPHGDGQEGVLRLPAVDRGECAHCHDMHASRGGMPSTGPYPWLLFAPNDNALCATAGCHQLAADDRIYTGLTDYESSSHAISGGTVWPGPVPPARAGTDAGLCVNCHDPHGMRDATGVVPSMVFLREEELCLGCHDLGGPAGTDIAGDFQRSNPHPIAATDSAHAESENGSAAAYGIANRHVECVDCHNPHRAASATLRVVPPEAPQTLTGVGRVSVVNGPAGLPPTFQYRAPDDPTPTLEYEVCFKCHSSWTDLPSGSDLALLFNPNNPSYHPVEGQGADPLIAPGSFVSGSGPSDVLYCSDCHNSGQGPPLGPHGSDHPFLLAGDHVASSQQRPMSPDEICFQCHRHDVYADDRAPDAVLGLSRFNPPTEDKGHAEHVGKKEYPCYACHASHGSTEKTKLIVTGRNPGINEWIETPSGGTCSPTCHDPESYSINYPR